MSQIDQNKLLSEWMRITKEIGDVHSPRSHFQALQDDAIDFGFALIEAFYNEKEKECRDKYDPDEHATELMAGTIDTIKEVLTHPVSNEMKLNRIEILLERFDGKMEDISGIDLNEL